MTAQTNCLNMSGVVFRMKHEPRFFVEMNVTGSKHPRRQEGEILVRIPPPFKDQSSANKLREQLRPCLHGGRVTLLEGSTDSPRLHV